MTSLYPGALDDFSENSPTYMSDPDATGRVHSARHDDVESGLEAVQAFIGARREATAGVQQVKWDETVGRRLFMWDSNNARWQMVYGDTGWRSVPKAGITGLAYLCRVGNTVTAVLEDAATSTSEYWQKMIDLPFGFRSVTSVPAGIARDAVTGTLNPMAAYFDAVAVGGAVAGNAQFGTISWRTADPWPSELPGAAAGVIPSALPDSVPDIDPHIPTGIAAP